MASCPACGGPMEEFPSYSENPRLSWRRCPACRRAELVVDESAPPPENPGRLTYVEFDFAALKRMHDEGRRGRDPGE